MLDVHQPIECKFTKRIVNIPWEASILLQLILGTWTIHVKGTRYNKCQTPEVSIIQTTTKIHTICPQSWKLKVIIMGKLPLGDSHIVCGK